MGRSLRPAYARLLVALAALFFTGSTLSGLWVTTVRSFGGWGSLRIYGDATPWDGYFLPLILVPLGTLAIAGATAALLLFRPGAGRRIGESRLYAVSGAIGAGAMAVALWLGPGGSYLHDSGSLITRSGVLAFTGLVLAGSPLVSALLISFTPWRLLAAAGSLLALIVLAVALTFHSTTPRFATASGAIPDWRSDPNEPYPFTTPVPPLLSTAVDGTYDRPPTENYPDRPRCTRCQPYPLDAGRSVLTFDRGRFRLEQQQPRYLSSGHYVVAGTHVTIFNDPECPSVRGVYRWHLETGRLALTLLFDPCGFGQRARDLTDRVWEVVER